MKSKRIRIGMVLLLIGMIAGAQTRRDPRCMGLGGAYGSLSRGIFAVDYNPANLAIPHEYEAYRILGGLGTGLSSNFLSLKKYKKYNGKNLEAGDGSLKAEFMADIPAEGWRFFTDLYFPLPYINHSKYNRAVSADLIVIGDLGLPRGLLEFIFDENPIGKTLDLDFQEELMAVIQYGIRWLFRSAMYLSELPEILAGVDLYRSES
jgi:hypothetical protein